jgi:hypothetical protein
MTRLRREHEQMEGPAFHLPYRSLREMKGGTDRRIEERQSTQQQQFRRAMGARA